MEANWIGYVDTMLEYYLGIDPGKLSDEQWGEKFAQLLDIRDKEAQAQAVN